MKLVIIFGNLAVGKMTVGQELAKITNLKLFHNHMTIEPVIPKTDSCWAQRFLHRYKHYTKFQGTSMSLALYKPLKIINFRVLFMSTFLSVKLLGFSSLFEDCILQLPSLAPYWVFIRDSLVNTQFLCLK